MSISYILLNGELPRHGFIFTALYATAINIKSFTPVTKLNWIIFHLVSLCQPNSTSKLIFGFIIVLIYLLIELEIKENISRNLIICYISFIAKIQLQTFIDSLENQVLEKSEYFRCYAFNYV